MLSGIRTILLSSTCPPSRSCYVISKMDYISDDEIKQHPPFLRRVQRNIREQNPRVIRGSFHVRAVSALLSLRSAVADIPSEKSACDSRFANRRADCFGGEGGIRTHGTLRYTAFRVRLVMTTSIRFHAQMLVYNKQRSIATDFFKLPFLSKHAERAQYVQRSLSWNLHTHFHQ